MQTKKVSILIVSLCLLLTSWASVAAQSVKYNFSVVFLAKTCEIVVPDNITFTSGEGASSVSANDIKNNKISDDEFIRNFILLSSFINMSNMYRKISEKLIDDYFSKL